MPDFQQMKADCRRLRNEIVDAIHRAKSGHTGGSLSCVEIIWTLYTEILRHRPAEPDWPDRDRFVLSKGHAAPTLYHVLADQGYYDKSLLADFRQAGSMFQGHADMTRVPGVEISAGSLGMGISVGVGMCLAGRLSEKDYKVYVLVGDGELQEGQNWEAMMAASKWALSNLVVIVDRNGVQLDGPTAEIMPMRDRPRARRSAKIFSQAIRSVCGVLKVKGCGGSMISMPPASEMKGSWASSNTGRIAMVVPVVVPPTMATTRSSSTSRVAKVRALLASPPSS